VAEVHRAVNTRKAVVDMDLKSYFDTIPHDRLMECVRHRVSDPRVLHLIRCWLKAGIMEEGEVRSPLSGTPQGGVLSPLLSNLYLHEMDKRMSRSDGKLIRFADDLVMLCYRSGQARWVLEKMRTILNELGLTVNEEKTRIGHVREGFDFLGFTYREAYSKRQGRLVRVKYPRAKSVRGIQQRIKAAIQTVGLGEAFSEVITAVNRKLRGWANYFRIGNSYAAALGLNEYVCEQLRIWWRRRKQNKRIRGGREWANAFFYRQGLEHLPALVRGGANAA
jgi:group II intron reverse transcriptase/maturase